MVLCTSKKKWQWPGTPVAGLAVVEWEVLIFSECHIFRIGERGF